MNIFKDLYNSFNTEAGGFSSRKLSAFLALVTAVWLSHKYTTPQNLDSIIITWLLFALLCLGLVTFGQIIQLKNGKDEPKQ